MDGDAVLGSGTVDYYDGLCKAEDHVRATVINNLKNPQLEGLRDSVIGRCPSHRVLL